MDTNQIENALAFIDRYGGIDGAHHKQWVLDQVVRLLTDCPTVTKTAVDHYGNRYEYQTLGESEKYFKWVRDHKRGEDGPDTYEWDEGIPP